MNIAIKSISTKERLIVWAELTLEVWTFEHYINLGQPLSRSEHSRPT